MTTTTTRAAAVYQAKKDAVMSGAYDQLKQILEKAVVDDLLHGDGPAFETNYSQLESLYLNAKCVQLTFDANERLCLGLGLMKYLKEDDMASFHVLLQHIRYMLEQRDHTSSALGEATIDGPWAALAYPLDLEREMVNGNLSGVLATTRQLDKLPHPAFEFFTKELEQSIKLRVCKAIESAYRQIPTGAAMRLLGLKTEEELLQFTESKMSEVWERSLRQPKVETFGSLATPQHSAQPAPSDRFRANERSAAVVTLARTSSVSHKTLHHKRSSGRAPEETIVFESKEPPKLWTISPDRKYVEIIDTAATRTYIPSSDLLKTWLKLTESLEAV